MTFIQEVRRVIEDYFENSTWTSASPAATNLIKDIKFSYEPDFSDVIPQDNGAQPPTLPGQEGAGDGTGIARSILSGINDPIGSFKNLGALTKLIPIIGTLVTAPEIIMRIRDILTDPGGPFDVRFKRDIHDEVLSSVERDEKSRLRQGLTIVRITSTPTFRGESGVGQTGQVGISGIARYDNDFEAFQKGLY